MIHLITHNEIDKNKWDKCIHASKRPSLYVMSWYLDAVSAGWNALVADDYNAVMPLCGKRKWGISYLYQPPYTQFGGVFSSDDDVFHADVFLQEATKTYKLIEINLPPNNETGFSHKEKTNQYLPLNQSYDALKQSYHRNQRRNVAKAKDSGCLIGEIDSWQFLDFKLTNQSSEIPDDVSVLSALIDAASDRKLIRCYAAMDEQGRIKAANMIIQMFNRLYLLASENTKEGKEQSLMFGILDHVFQSFAGQDMIFDFEGSSLPGVNAFNAGFGAQNEYYLSLKINRLPFPFIFLKN